MPATSALVIGGSLAGMCAARALMFFHKDEIIEGDADPWAPYFPTGRSASPPCAGRRPGGLREFESFFPGFEFRMRNVARCPWIVVRS